MDFEFHRRSHLAEMERKQQNFQAVTNYEPDTTTWTAKLVWEETFSKEQFIQKFPQFADRHMIARNDFNIHKMRQKRGIAGNYTYFCLEDYVTVKKVSITEFPDTELYTTSELSAGHVTNEDGEFVAKRFMWSPTFNKYHYYYAMKTIIV